MNKKKMAALGFVGYITANVAFMQYIGVFSRRKILQEKYAAGLPQLSLVDELTWLFGPRGSTWDEFVELFPEVL